MENNCRVEDDGMLSADFIVVEGADEPQALWIGVRPVYYGSKPSDYPVIQVCLQDSYMGSTLRGPVFITPEAWDDLVQAVEWRLRKHKRRKKRGWRLFR